VVLAPQAVSGVSESLSQCDVAEQMNARGGERVRIVGEQEVLAVTNVEAVGADARGNDRDAMREGFQDLHASAAAEPERDRHHVGLGELGFDPLDFARERHVGARTLQAVVVSTDDAESH
jgi:hypothetical protein